jgi:hypothetical protein
MLSATRMPAMVSSADVARTLAPLLLLLWLPHGAPAEDRATPAGPETWYTERIITGLSTPGVEHLWSKGPWLRSELVVAGQPIVQVVRGDRYLIWNRIDAKGVAIQRSREVILAGGGEAVGDDQVGGQACTVYRLTDEDGRRETCVSTAASHVPLRTGYWQRSTNRSSEIRYLSWVSQVPLPDSFFEPGPGVTLEEYGYEQYLEAIRKGPVGPAPPTFGYLLHGR